MFLSSDSVSTFIKNEISTGGPFKSNEHSERWKEINGYQTKLDQCVGGFDERLEARLKHHEYEYMSAYNIQVKRKEQ